MKHLVVGTTMIVLIIISILIGCICWLYRFNRADFYKGTRFINKHVIVGFADWMPWT